jgi:serine/threonine protein kinase
VLLREAEALRARRHRNIIPLFASFSAGREEPVTTNDTQECLHMLFPEAKGGDLKAWLQMREPADELLEDSKRQECVQGIIQDIVSGVAFIHREVIARRYMFHHDLKPGNILRFFENGLPIWKIADFGNARIKDLPIDELTGTVHTDENRFGTYTYRPPEYFNGSNQPHGRSFDVYSLGCVLLELATVHEYGWTNGGLPKFREQRKANKEHQYNGPEKQNPDYSFHNNPKVVQSWIEHLKETGSRTLCEILDLINLMLRSRADQRIFVWEVEMELFELLNPHASMEERQEKLKLVVQNSKSPLTQLHNQHNPLQRAIVNNKPEWWKAILTKHNWSYSSPAMTPGQLRPGVQPIKQPCSNLRDFSYLSVFRGRNEFFGRHDIHTRIEKAYEKSNFVGLYGLSGIG